MSELYEKQDSLNNPIESFIFDAAKEAFPVKPHWHYFAEIIHVIKGSMEVLSDGVSYIMHEGETLLLYPSSVHSMMETDKGGKPVYYVIKFDLNKFPGNTSYAPSLMDLFKYAASSGMPVFFDKEESGKMHLAGIFDSSVREMRAFEYGADIVLKSHVYMIIYRIVRNWISRGLDINSCPTRAKDSYGIDTIPEYIDMHLQDNLKVKDLAAVCHISYSGFAGKFNEQYGMSCKEYIERMRMFKADEYLLFTDMDISEISRLTGFNDSSHFIHAFRRYKGITPKRYRLMRQKGVSV